MDMQEFQEQGAGMLQYIGNYLTNLEDRSIVPRITPGYLKDRLPKEAPQGPEQWNDIMADVDKHIMPGVTHWQHPHFHAYFPSGSSFPSLLGGLLSDAIGAIGFSWRLVLGLQPDDFLMLGDESEGGGVIQGSASECVLTSLLAARNEALIRIKNLHPEMEEGMILSKLVAYCSKESHSCVEKAALIGFVKIRLIDVDHKHRLRGFAVAKAVKFDKQNGFFPFFVSATLGTTSCCSFDCIEEIGSYIKDENIWFHVDAAYAGCAFVCPELRGFLKGIEYADSINTNCNKFLLVNFDCSVLWLKDRLKLTRSMVVNPLYLQHRVEGCPIDYRHWQIPLSRRFRALKLWFVIRRYGVSGLQNYVRRHCILAKRFAHHVAKDSKFVLCNDVVLGLVCFRMKDSDNMTERLLDAITTSRKLFMIPALLHGKLVIRFCVCAERASEGDVDYAWRIISSFAHALWHDKQMGKFFLDELCELDEGVVVDDHQAMIHKGSAGETRKGSNAEIHKGSNEEIHNGEIHKGCNGEIHKGSAVEIHNGCNGKIHKGSNENIHKGSNENIHKGSNENIHKGSNVNIHKGSNGEIQNGCNGEIHKGSNGEIHNGCNGDIHNGCKGDILKGCNGYIHKGCNGDLHKGCNGDLHKGCNGELHKGCNGEIHKGCNGEIHKGFNGEIHKGCNGDILKGCNGEIHKGSNGEIHKGSNGEIHKGCNGEIHKGCNGDILKGCNGDIHKGSNGDIHNGEILNGCNGEILNGCNGDIHNVSDGEDACDGKETPDTEAIDDLPPIRPYLKRSPSFNRMLSDPGYLFCKLEVSGKEVEMHRQMSVFH